jgi:uncharacterized repeat protein (TIGR01451 family)
VSGLAGVVKLAGGSTYSLALKADGNVWAWGDNQSGQLGDGTAAHRPMPVQVSGLRDVITVAAGYDHSLALQGDGTVWQWGGLTWNGQSSTINSTPVVVRGLASIVGIAAGSYSNFSWARDGTVWQWDNQTAPFQVSGPTNVVDVAIGIGGWFDYYVALKDDGTVWALDGSGTWAPVSGLTGIKAVAAGGYAMLALKADGAVWQWDYATSPAPVNGLSEVVAIGAGYEHCLALRSDGAVWAWGWNEHGQLGDGTDVQTREMPVQVGGLNSVAVVAGGGLHSLALKLDGTVWAWGWSQYGQLGDEKTSRLTPVQVIAPGSPDLAIAMSHEGDFAVGGQGVYTVTLTNMGFTATAGTITVTDTLPPGLTYSSGAGSGWACSAPGQAVTCTNSESIVPSASSRLAITVEVSTAAWPGVTNLATVDNESDRNLTNNAVGDPTVVGP